MIRAEPGVGGPRLGHLITSMRALQDSLSAAIVPQDAIDDVIDRVERLVSDLGAWAVPDTHAVDMHRTDLPGRASLLLPPFTFDEVRTGYIRGHVTFSRFHLGGNGAAHGGAIPLLFDEILGRLIVTPDRPAARTAHLSVNYRSIARLGRELGFEATARAIHGRKRYATVVLRDGEAVVADGEALFVELRPGQP